MDKFKLIRVTKSEDIDKRKLMDIYAESNRENTSFLCPDERDEDTAISVVEEGYMGLLEDEFFKNNGATCWILSVRDEWKSAFRTVKVKDGLYYLEVLEKKPEERGKGYGAALLSMVIVALKKEGPFILSDNVGKHNYPSLRIHEKCGFSVVSDIGFDYIYKEEDKRQYRLEYRYGE